MGPEFNPTPRGEFRERAANRNPCPSVSRCGAISSTCRSDVGHRTIGWDMDRRRRATDCIAAAANVARVNSPRSSIAQRGAIRPTPGFCPSTRGCYLDGRRRATNCTAARDKVAIGRRVAWCTSRFGVRDGTGGHHLDGWRRSADHAAVRNRVAIDGGFTWSNSRFNVRRGSSGRDLDGWRRAAYRTAPGTVAIHGSFAAHRVDARPKRKLTRISPAPASGHATADILASSSCFS
jgi:hypothetical protein